MRRCDRDGIMEKTLIRLYRCCRCLLPNECYSKLERDFHKILICGKMKTHASNVLMDSKKTTMFGLCIGRSLTLTKFLPTRQSDLCTKVLMCNMFDDDRIVAFSTIIYINMHSMSLEGMDRKRNVLIITSCRLSRFTAIAFNQYKTLHM